MEGKTRQARFEREDIDIDDNDNNGNVDDDDEGNDGLSNDANNRGDVVSGHLPYHMLDQINMLINENRAHK